MSYYLQFVLIPISTHGKIQIDSQRIKEALLLFPKIIISVALAILLHLFLDQFAHFDDARGLSMRIEEGLGYEQYETDAIYKILLYLPQLIISGLGLILTVISLFLFRRELFHTLHFLLKHLFSTFFLATFIFISFTSMKIIKAGVEQGMEIDSLLIGVTCGLMSAFLLTPVVLWLFLKIPARQYILFPIISVFSIYMLGLVFKEYLAIYIAKGLFVTAFSFIAFVIIHAARTDWKLIGLLLADIALISIHPFTDYFTFLLLFQFILLLGLTFFKKIISPFTASIIKGTVIASIFSLAYYASNKGLGPGIVVIYIMGICYEFSQSKYSDIKVKSILSFVAKLLLCMLIASVKTQLGILAIALLCVLTISLWISKQMTQNTVDFIFFSLGTSLLATIYISIQFSILYGIFSAAQILFMLMLAYSNRVKPEENTEYEH